MKKTILISVYFLLSFSFISQTAAQNLTTIETVSIKNEVEHIFKKMLTFAEKLDYDALSFGVDDTQKAGFISNKKYYTKYATLIEELKPIVQGVDKQNISITKKKTTVLSNKIVLMTVSGISNANLSDGRKIAANFHWSFVYEKINNQWKVIHSHQSQGI